MTYLLEILKYILPTLVTLAFVYMIIKSFLDNETKRRNLEVQKRIRFEQSKISLPLRLQAYERIIVFLERIHPFSLLPDRKSVV